jgi:hypothetical protein
MRPLVLEYGTELVAGNRIEESPRHENRRSKQPDQQAQRLRSRKHQRTELGSSRSARKQAGTEARCAPEVPNSKCRFSCKKRRDERESHEQHGVRPTFREMHDAKVYVPRVDEAVVERGPNERKE